ncbi:SusC/RagA family TonB-linked outer membrane protein [Chitinophaga sp. B61]|uniref:SusC/RagA family TonB-linked outer membrane protein n=2 Tax=Chitinophaga rhizophila TaxID=2866212 RepID=A0ABS7GLG8_9BACT|nr:SusC/RagA family TonB-linked outer membrane protein [Chitinophaga rhizophila]
MLLLSLVAFSQNRTITGRVTDAQGNTPLPGVTVQVKGTSKGTQTGPDGTYKLEIPQGSTTLVFTFVGYKKLEQPISASATTNATLAADVTALKDVVVVGYGTQKKTEVTSAIASISQEDFRQSGARNPLDLVQGKVAGLQITRTSGSNPNTSPAIQVRSATTLNNNQGPLVVIDGIPNGNLDLLQQDDIESISVLKDGSAAAIYGTQANAGVILVTTKRGKAGGSRVDYNTYFRKEYLQRRPDFLSPDEYAAKIASGEIVTTDRGHRTDFLDLLINDNNLTQYHNLAFSGGNDGANYRASVYYNNMEGLLKENGRQQYGGRLSITSKGLDNRLTAQFNLATNFNKANLLTDGGNLNGYLTFQPTYSPYNEDGSWYFEQTSTNELARLHQQTDILQQQTTSGDAKVTLDIVKGLKGSIFGSIIRDNLNRAQYAERASELSIEQRQGGGYAYQQSELKLKYAVEPTLEYNLTLDRHNISAVGGYSYRYEVNQGFDANNYGFQNDIFRENNLNAGNQLVLGKAGMGSYKNDNTLIAFFGRVNYVFNDKYMASAIIRREGSSRFGANNKWGNFPAISAGWNVHKESFLQDAAFISQLKLRLGYGITGNSGFDNYASLVTMGTGGNYINPDGVWRQTYGPNRNPNPDLRWETKREWNLGIDYGFFNGRLSGALDLFRRKTVDVLSTFTSQVPSFVQRSIYTNVGSFESQGIELSVNATIMEKKDFRWTTDVAFSNISNKMTSFSNDIYKLTFIDRGDIGGYGALGTALRTYEGGRIGNFYGKRFAGFTDEGKWRFYKADGTTGPADEISRDKDFAVIGNGIPKYQASMTNTFRYKNWDLRVFMRGKFGYQILNTLEMLYGNRQGLPSNVLRSTFTKHAKLNDSFQYSDYYLENGSFVKLDEVTLGYNVPFRNKYIRSMRVYFTGGNLATITGYSGNDPDFVKDTGLNPGIDALNNSDDRRSYLSSRSFMFGLNVSF